MLGNWQAKTASFPNKPNSQERGCLKSSVSCVIPNSFRNLNTADCVDAETVILNLIQDQHDTYF